MYKLSQFNYFLEHNDRVIYFNGLSAALFSMSKTEHQNMSQLFEDLIYFQIQYESVFNRFKEWGFIVNEEIDEIDSLRLRNKTAVFSDREYRLIINPTEDCVFNCWYCSQHQADPKGGMSDETISYIKNHLDYMIKNNRISSLFLDWFGGEPLMYFNEVIYPIAKHALKLVNKYNLPLKHHTTTNAYLIDKEMVKKMKEIKLNSFQITLDGDRERHNKIRNAKGEPSFDKIMDNINMILEEIPDSVIGLRVNYDDATLKISDMKSVFSKIPEKYRKRVFPNFVRVWQTIKKNPTNENKHLHELIQVIKQLGYVGNEVNSFQVGKAYRCYADRFHHTVINYNGKVYKCTAHTNKEMGTLQENGYIKWNQEELSKLYATPTFENQRCLSCKHLPICLGSCTQSGKTKMEPGHCILDHSDISPQNFIIDMYENKMNTNIQIN